MAPRKKTTIRLEDVCFYFDTVERDRLDAGGASRKSGEILALRDQLLRLPDSQFDAAVKTLRGMLAPATSSDGESGKAKRRAQQALYEQLPKSAGGGSGASATTKVAPA